jgi:hypothetical protein
VLLRLRSHFADGGAGRLVRARREDAPGSALEQRGEDRGDLLGGLPLGEDGLGSALPKLAVGVDPGKPEVAIGQLRQTLERVVGGRRPVANGLEQLAQIFPKPAHGAIVR